MRGKLFLFALLWIGLIAVMAAIPGCYGENCNGTLETFPVDSGRMTSETQWESNAPDEAWLPFPKQRTYVFDIPALGGRVPSVPIPYVSATEFQSQGGANFVIGAGNIAAMSGSRPNGINIYNDTCSDYYLRLTIGVEPFPPGTPTAPPTPDAGL